MRIVALEFNSWQSRNSRPLDRLDLLGIDEDGRLVITELKRGLAPDFVETQAIKYAAMASRFDSSTLAACHARYLTDVGESKVSEDDARGILEDHIGGDFDPELLKRPRIILMAEGFPPQVSASAVWLTEMGIDVSLIEFGAWQTGKEIVLTVSQTWPIPDAEEFVVTPKPPGDVRERTRSRREATATKKIVDGGLLDDGVQLDLVVEAFPVRMRPKIARWLAEKPGRALATWRNHSRLPLAWSIDGKNWSPTGLAKEIGVRATGELLAVINGPEAWQSRSGKSLAELAGFSWARGIRRDWDALHKLLNEVRSGEWTTYGDLANLVESSPIAVGRHIATCGDCSGGYRVLNSDGSVSDNFNWSDPTDERDPIQVLIDEGVLFPGGKADADQRLSVDALLTRSKQSA